MLPLQRQKQVIVVLDVLIRHRSGIQSRLLHRAAIVAAPFRGDSLLQLLCYSATGTDLESLRLGEKSTVA